MSGNKPMTNDEFRDLTREFLTNSAEAESQSLNEQQLTGESSPREVDVQAIHDMVETMPSVQAFEKMRESFPPSVSDDQIHKVSIMILELTDELRDIKFKMQDARFTSEDF